MQLKLITTEADRLMMRMRRLAEAKMKSAPIQAAKYLHKSVRHSIRVSKNPSKPGKPPHTRTRQSLKNAISSKVEYNGGQSVVNVGLSDRMGSRKSLTAIAGLHEAGGTVKPSPIQYHIGQVVPIAKKDGAKAAKGKSLKWLGAGYIFVRSKTQEQVRRGNDLARAARPSTSATYPARPFLKPTLAKAMKAPGFLRIFFLKQS